MSVNRYRYSELPASIRAALSKIVPSGDDKLPYYPCLVKFRSGEELDRVYLVAEDPFRAYWGMYPEEDRSKNSVRLEDVLEVKESPTRLPAEFANQIYRGGESGMGLMLFTVIFDDGTRQVCANGGAVDFIRYPDGKGPSDVVKVVPHEGRGEKWVWGPDYFWCLYSGPVE